MAGQSFLSGDAESTFRVMSGSQLCSTLTVQGQEKSVWCDEYQKANVRAGNLLPPPKKSLKHWVHRHSHTNTHTERRHPPAGRKMSFHGADDSIFSPMVQHFDSRPLTKRLNLKKRIVPGKLTNVLYTQGLMSGMKASF